MRLNARSPRHAMHWMLFAALFALATPCLAQDEAKPAEPAESAKPAEKLGPISVEIDFEKLLFESRGNNLQDPVWRLQAGSGRRILYLPFTVDNIHRPSKLSRFPISVRAGRFIGFVIPKPELNKGSGTGNDLNRVIRAAPGELQELLFETIKEDDALEQEANNSPEEEAQEPTPDNAPRLAREITLRPDGTVQWAMARSFHAGQLQSASDSNLYAYKIDPEQLRAQQPPRAERLSRNDNEDSRAFAQRKRDHQEAEREKQNAYRDLRDSLRNLPETFREPAPTVLYAAIEVSAEGALALEGPAPLPWRLDAEKEELFAQLARGGNVFKDQEGEGLAGSIVTLIQGHPLDARAVAIATVRSKLASQVASDDAGYKVLTRLLQSEDIPTRRIALYGIATVTPPSIASAKLIGVAGEAALGDERNMLAFASLSKLFSTRIDDVDSARVLIDRVSQTIADPQGPAAPRVIEQVLASLNESEQMSRSQVNREASAVLIEAIDFAGVEKDEFAGVAKAIVAQAPDNPIAAGWLDQKLLSSTDREQVNQSLAALYEAQIKAPVPEGMMDSDTADTAPDTAVDAGTLLLSGTIPMTRPGHALIGLFESDDELQQAAAWAVLGRFHIALPEADTRQALEPGSDITPVEPALALLDSILEKAAAREKMPASVVAFLVNQKGRSLVAPANDRLIALLADPDLAQKTAVVGTEAFIASPERYRQSVQGLSSVDKEAMVRTMYRANDMKASIMVGLIADRNNTVNWLSDYLKEQGQLPTEAAWVEHAQRIGEGSLLRGAASEDVTLASASAAALVLSAGGSESQASAFDQKVRFMASRQPEVIHKEWDQHREKIFAAAFKRAAGTYQLVVTLSEPAVPDEVAEKQPDAQAGGEPDKQFKLGLLELRVEGVALSLSVESIRLSPTSTRLGIRLENPAALHSLNRSELARISPDHLRQPIDMLPEDNGAWAGQTTLPDGRSFRVSLEPEN